MNKELLHKEFELLEIFGDEGVRVYEELCSLIKREGEIKAALYSPNDLAKLFNCSADFVTDIFWHCVKAKMLSANYYTEPNTLEIN